MERRKLRHKMKSKLWDSHGKRVKAAANRLILKGQSHETSSLADEESEEEGVDIGIGVENMVDTTTNTNNTGLGSDTLREFELANTQKHEEGGLRACTEQLQVVSQLKQWCARNPYARAILNVELARIERNEDKQVRLCLCLCLSLCICLCLCLSLCLCPCPCPCLCLDLVFFNHLLKHH